MDKTDSASFSVSMIIFIITGVLSLVVFGELLTLLRK